MITIDKLNPEWDLSQLYTSFQDPSFARDLYVVEADLAVIKNMLVKEVEFTAEYLLNCLKSIDTTNLLFSNLSSFVTLNLLVNSSHSEALHFSEKISILQATSHQISIILQQKVSTLDNIEHLISDCEGLVPYAYLLRESHKFREYNATAEIEDVISQMQLTGSSAWLNLRNSLDGAAMVPITINGEQKKLPLSEVRSLASNPSKEIRRDAYIAELKAYKNYEVPMAACLSAIKGEALTTSELRGYETVLSRMLDINKMDQTTLDIMINSIESNLPAFHNYLKTKSRLLGYENGLPWYEILAPIGKSSLTFTYEEASGYLTNIFTNFDKDMGAFIKHAFKNQWIDALPKEGKVGGALCADLPTLRQNRVFVNFSGSYSDVRILAHELGHAFHSRCLDQVPLVMRDAPTPVCETASIFNETIVQEQLMLNVTPEERLFLLEAGLREVTQTVVDIYSRFLFEKEVFKRRKTHNLSARELCEIMQEAQLLAYGDSLDPNYLHPYMWMCKVHYYIPEFHYYNFPYTFGLLFAKGLYSHYKSNTKGFMKGYINLLSSTCSDDMAGIMKCANIDIHSEAFWDSSFSTIIDDINQFSELAK